MGFFEFFVDFEFVGVFEVVEKGMLDDYVSFCILIFLSYLDSKVEIFLWIEVGKSYFKERMLFYMFSIREVVKYEDVIFEFIGKEFLVRLLSYVEV